MKKLVSLVLVLAMVLSLVACGGTQEPAAPAAEPAEAAAPAAEEAAAPAAEEPAAAPAESKLIYGTTSSMSGDLGQYQWSSLGGDRPVIGLINAMAPTAFDQNARWVWDQMVVAEHESVNNEDGTLTYTIKLNDGLKWSDGSPMNAKNYVAYYLLFSSPVAAAQSAYATAGREFIGHQDYKDGVSKTFKGVELVDDLTYRVTMSKDYNPYYYGPSILCNGSQMIPVDYKQWLGDDAADVADDGEGAYFVTSKEFNNDNYGKQINDFRFVYEGRNCSGPYYLESWDVAANEAVLKLNPNYPGNFEGQKATIETIVVKLVNRATMLDQLKNGEVDLIDGIGEGDMINAALDMEEAGGFATNVYKYSGYMKLFYQCDWGPTQFDAVRQAITYLTNREAMTQEATLGYGNVTNGQYSMAQWMAQELEEELATELNQYPYDPAKAVEVLKEDGWVYNADGSDYVDGSGELRYKKVTDEQAMKGSEEMPGIVTIEGQKYMPLLLEYLGHAEGEGIETVLDETLTVSLIEAPSTAEAGMKFNKTVMADGELLTYLNRRGANPGAACEYPSYNLISLASGLGAAKFDKSGTWTFDEANIANNKNRYFNHKLDDLSNQMIYGVEAFDDETFAKVWFEYQKEYNAHLPETPLYNWSYCAVFSDKVKNFEETNIWQFYYAVLYATVA